MRSVKILFSIVLSFCLTGCFCQEVVINPYSYRAVEQVTFQEAGTGSAVITATNLTPSYPVTGLQAGDIFFCHAAVRNLSTVFETPSGWTLVSTDHDSNQAGHSWIFYKIATGSESGNLTLTTLADGTDVKLARIYRFRGSYGDDLFGTQVMNFATSTTTVTAPTVVSTNINALAVCFTYEADNIPIPSFTGETGGDWTNIAEYSTGLGADGLLALHTAILSSPGTISGGSSTMAAGASWVSRAFALYRSSTPAPEARSGRLYAITLSQSNGNGQAAISDIAATGRTELLDVIPRSYIWWEGADGVGWQPLQAGVNGNTLGNSYFGPIISMAYAEHVKYPSVDKFYVAHSVGGATAAAWVSLSNFFLAKYDACLANLTPTVYVGIATFHGESDAANEVTSLAYEAAEDVLIANIFANTGFTDAFVLQLHIYLPSGTFPYDDNIRTAKINNDTNGNYGTNGGLATAPTGSVMQGDNIHYNALGVITAGENISAITP